MKNYDTAVRDCVESFLSCSFSDPEWLLAGLSSKLGGLGLRSTELHSPAAFLSSQIACKDLCPKLDPYYVWDSNDQDSNTYNALNAFNTLVEPEKTLQSINDASHRQQIMSQAIDESTLRDIKESRPNDTHFKAHLNLITASGASSWLHAIPSKAIGTYVDPLLYKTMVQRRLRSPIFEDAFNCPLCDEVVDRFGDHCLTCACGGDRTKRHNLIRNEVFYVCISTGLNPELERPGLLQPRPLVGAAQENGVARNNNRNRRPADLYIPRWRRGIPAALDFAVTSGLRSDQVNRSAEDGSASTIAYENFKRQYQETEATCRAEGINFIPIICEADGGG